MNEHACGTALVPVRSDTRWFQDLVLADGCSASAVLFLRGRVAFAHTDHVGRSRPDFASCLVAYGRRDGEVLSACGLPGRCVILCFCC